MRFVVDAQLPPRLALDLREAGHEADHVESLGMRDAKDGDIWSYAVQNNAVILTKDEDFVDRLRRRTTGPQIVWLRIGNCSNAVLVAHVMPILPVIIRQLEAGERLVEVRR